MNVGLVTKALGPLLVAGTAAGATWALTGPVLASSTPEARAWFDAPLAGAILPVGSPVEVVAHATDADGVDVVELRVDGKEETTVTGGGGSLVTVELVWDPPGAGTYELEVRGVDEGDHAGEPGVVTITVGEPQTATTTTTAAGATSSSTGSTDTTTTTTLPGSTTTGTGPTTTSPGTTTTTTPAQGTTTTTCAKSAPTLVSPPNGSSSRAAPTLAWAYSGCPVDGFRVEVFDLDGADVGGPAAPDQRSWDAQGYVTCLGPDYPYTWRIGAVIAGQVRYSATWSFTCG